MSQKMANIGEGFTISADVFAGKCAAILGIRGSGKTNTAAVIIEELLSAGYPMAIVDIDGEYWGLKEEFDVITVGASSHVDFRVSSAQGEPSLPSRSSG